MANELVEVKIPSYLSTILAANPELEELNKELGAGFAGSPAYPQIRVKGMRFRVIDGDIDTVLKSLEIPVVVLRAKEHPERSFYMKPFVEGEEVSPDCCSSNGVTPNADYHINATCAGCAHNVWGTGKKSDGTPSDGKACKERKFIVVAPVDANGIVTEKAFGMSLPTKSGTPWSQYVKQLDIHGVKVPLVVTKIGFSEKESYPVFTFTYGGPVLESEIPKIVRLIKAPEVLSMIDAKVPTMPPTMPPTTPTPTPPTMPPTMPPTETAAEKEKRHRRTKAEMEAAKAAEAKPTDNPFEAAEPETKPADNPFESATSEVVQDPGVPSQAAIAAALGLPFALHGE